MATGIREAWVATLVRIAGPVLRAAGEGRLKEVMPVELSAEAEARGRREVSHWEAFCRSFVGVGPWLGLEGGPEEEGRLREELRSSALAGLRWYTDPDNPDALGANLPEGDRLPPDQSLVEAAFLACGLLRAPRLLDLLSEAERANLLEVMGRIQRVEPVRNNWLLFASVVEALVARLGGQWKADRVEDALSSHEEWYKGDGIYGDGPLLSADYYNSFVIHPLLLDTLEALGEEMEDAESHREVALERARRYGCLLERLIGPDGTYPMAGRSVCYRFGTFHHLSYLAFKEQLPEELSPGQVRAALTAVINRQLQGDTFDTSGWLRIGFCGHQPELAESYISTGSLYLCTTLFTVLGLPADNPFWREPDLPWTGKRAWSGESVSRDVALERITTKGLRRG